MKNNIFLEHRAIIGAIAENNRTAPGEVHRDGCSYENSIDMGVALSMFYSDLTKGLNFYYPEYPEGLAEQVKALDAAEIDRQQKEFFQNAPALFAEDAKRRAE